MQYLPEEKCRTLKWCDYVSACVRKRGKQQQQQQKWW